jgi:hypothetical protein
MGQEARKKGRPHLKLRVDSVEIQGRRMPIENVPSPKVPLGFVTPPVEKRLKPSLGSVGEYSGPSVVRPDDADRLSALGNEPAEVGQPHEKSHQSLISSSGSL